MVLSASSSAYADSGLLPVWDVESPVFNALGGSYNSYGSDGCQAVLQRTLLVHRGPEGHSLKITYNNRNSVSCGFWMHLFREGAKAEVADLPDMKRFPFLSFWMKEGGRSEDVEIRMADAVWLAQEDSKAAGRAVQYLKGLPEGGWREVVVPYRDFKLPSSKAAVVALQFAPKTSGVLYVDDFGFKSSADAQPGYTTKPASVMGAARPRGMWLWESTLLLKSAEREHETFASLQEARITDLFLQAPHESARTDVTQLELKPELRRFLRAAHEHGVRVHALEGFPEFALRDNHEAILSLVRNIVSFNSSNPAEERFDGIHLDNEPYLLLGFEGPSRDSILQEYLELNEKVARVLRGETQGLTFGIDIPFWWDSSGDREHPCCRVQFKGTSDSAAHHIIDLVDSVYIMAYRSFAGGMDGIVNHSQGDVEYAGKKGKQAFVAVETFRSPPEDVTFLAAIKESRWQALPANSKLLRLSRFQGYPLRSFTDGLMRYVGLADKRDPATQTSAQAFYARAAGSLLHSLPGEPADWLTDLREFQRSAERYGRTSGEWRSVSVTGLEKFDAPGGFGLAVIQNMPAKITLAGTNREFVEEVLQEVSDSFGAYTGFAGDAIHSLESYQQLKRK